MTDETLWPTDILTQEIITPVSVLKEQAAKLSELTSGDLRATVETTVNGSRMTHQMFIVVPVLNDYRFGLLQVSHDFAALYPAWIQVSRWTKPATSSYLGGQLISAHFVVKNEPELRAALKEIFSDEVTRNILSALLSQARS